MLPPYIRNNDHLYLAVTILQILKNSDTYYMRKKLEIAKALTAITFIDKFRVYVESHKLRHMKQCYFYSRFHLSFQYCPFSLRGLKCVQRHSTYTCSKKDRSTLASCRNCSGAHSANPGFCLANPNNKFPLT